MSLDEQSIRLALDRFLRSVETRAYRMALVATGRREEALDIVQDSMMKLAQKYSHKPEEEWPMLFMRILQNGIRDWYRRQKVKQRFMFFSVDRDNRDEEQDFGFDIADEENNPARRLEYHGVLKTLVDAVQNLPIRQQQVFLLRAWDGLDVESTAQILGVSSGSIKTHYSRALKSLHSQLGDDWYGAR